MMSLLYLLVRLLDFYTFIIFAYVICSWLIQFNIINISNKFVWVVLDSLKKLTNPALNLIRKVIPNFGSVDISPVILLLGVHFIRDLLLEYWPRSL